MTMPTEDQMEQAADLLRPKGSQPADDVPVAVITLFRSSYVLAGTGPEFDLSSTGHRRWFADRCYQAAQSIINLDPAETNNIITTAPEVLTPLNEADSQESFMASSIANVAADYSEATEEAPEVSRTHFEVYQGEDGWRWRLRAGNGEPIASGEAYATKRSALHAVALIADVDGDTRIEALPE